MNNPKQSKTLHIEMLGEELSVYDWKRLKMHSLNPTATKVFALCDGTNSPAQMAARLTMPEAAIWQALDELSKANLLQAQVAAPSDMSRRQFLKLGGAVAAAAIVSIVVPRPVAAQSGGSGIVRTAVVGTANGGANNFVALSAPITDAEITSAAPTQIEVSWSSGVLPTGAGWNLRFLQSSGGPGANLNFIFAVAASPQTSADANIWTGNRDYTFLNIFDGGGFLPDWNVGTVTITLS